MDDVVVRDRISELPSEILDNILGRLPTKDAVATTILSRKFRDKWVDVSNLFFDDSRNDNETMDSKFFIKFVYHVLLSHRGKIDKFTLTSRGLGSYIYDYDTDCLISTSLYEEDFRCWIPFLSRKDVKELTIYFSPVSTSPFITLPSSLFSCNQLRCLNITNCEVRMPENFSGFSTLVSLHLACCTCTDEAFDKMINSSPNLEKLALTYVCNKRLTICAPSLKYLSLEGYFRNVSLGNCPLLHDVSFKMTWYEEGTLDGLVQPRDGEDTLQGTLHKFAPPDWLCRARRLVMTGQFLKFLAERCYWLGASIGFPNLEVLELDTVNFDDTDEMAVALSIFRRSSNLNIVIINIDTYRSAALSQGKCCFNKLRLVRITILPGMYEINRGAETDETAKYGLNGGAETDETAFLEIIRLLLAGSPVLENMHIHYTYSEKCYLWFMRKLLSCERASSQLKLTFEPTKGNSFD